MVFLEVEDKLAADQAKAYKEMVKLTKEIEADLQEVQAISGKLREISWEEA